jgi:hypothetical protein
MCSKLFTLRLRAHPTRPGSFIFLLPRVVEVPVHLLIMSSTILALRVNELLIIVLRYSFKGLYCSLHLFLVWVTIGVHYLLKH